MEAEAPPHVSTELHTLDQETKEAVETPTDFSTKLRPEEDENKEAKIIVDTTHPLSKEQKRKEENEASADASEPHSIELGGKSKGAETSNELQAPKRKTRKVLKPRSKIAKKSPASNSLDKKKAEEISTKLQPEEDENKEAGIIMDTTQPLSKEQERKEENEAPADAFEPHSIELEGRSKGAETSNELQAPKKKTRKVLKPRSEISKTSPAINSLNKKTAKVTVAELEGKEEIKKKAVSLINNGNSSIEVGTTDALCMEQENKEEIKSAADFSAEPHSMELENKNKVAGTSNELPAQQKNEVEIQAAPEVSTEPHSVELKKKSESALTSEKMQAPRKRTVKVLKARSKIVKKSPAIASSMKKKVEATIPKVEVEKATKAKDVLSVKNGNSSKGDSLKQSTSGDKMLRNADDLRSEGKDDCNLKGGNSCTHVEKNAKEPAADNSEKNGSGVLGKSKRKWKETVKQKSNKSLNNLKDNEKPDNLEKKPRKEKKEKLGGLIFMCNSKTKPDCLSYGVMGISLSKKDLVLGVRPGLKLFLYDYDLKLMYGIYKATSPGGMRLEPSAFNGAFPVQVRFKVHLECYPLPETIFKKGMGENFTTKHKFKTELSIEQVSRLAALFRPVELHVKELPARSPRLTKSRMGDSHVRARESRHLSRRETSSRDPYAEHQSRRLPELAHESDRPVVGRELAPRPRAESREMYLTEQEYRAFGLRGERRNADFRRHISPTLRPYREDHERERIRRLPEEIHREAAPARRDNAVGRSYTSDRGYRTYSLHPREELHSQVPPRAGTSAAAAFNSYQEDPYDAYQHGAASADPYAHRSRREDIPSGSLYGRSRRESYLTEKDHLRRRAVDRDESLPRYIDDLLGHDRAHRYGTNENNAASLPVSSRYSFAGPRI
ncbi:microtubule-associated protein futsch-like [Rhodamnia argentea]|uniref:Microtubule-associated protein futsch-like n=1 Tax=Rhodamnia argentea TaxID=178133 RepID=A0A8B8MYM1_9MYRT|nr:microtubule-associated protein futsch-like [Rhodamnia argentea]